VPLSRRHHARCRQHRAARGFAIDGRTTRHVGYAVSQRLRKRVEEIFGWSKTVGGMRRSRFKGRETTQLFALIVGTAYNLMRMARILKERRRHEKSTEKAPLGGNEEQAESILVVHAVASSSNFAHHGQVAKDFMEYTDFSAPC